MTQNYLIGAAATLLLAPALAAAQVGPPPVPPAPLANAASVVRAAPPVIVRQDDTRWSGVPGGWGAYQAPRYGQVLPRYWAAPAHFIADHHRFGLPRPAYGYGWSRYYDDMVLTDRWGRVYDWRDGRDEHRRHKRDRFDRHDRADYRPNWRPDWRPHWDDRSDDLPTGDCACETVTTTTVTTQGKPIVTKHVRYVTEYVTVRPRTKSVPRRKYVPLS